MSSLRHEAEPDALAEAVAEAADAWGGSFSRQGRGGELVLPVQAGLRHGRLQGQVEVRPEEAGSHLTLTVERIDYRVHRPAVTLLLMGAAAGVVLALWPFVPGLEKLLPLALMVLVGVWFLVISRLQNRGADEFLTTVDAFAGAEEGGQSEGPPPLSPQAGLPQPETPLEGAPGTDPKPTEPRSWS